MLALSFEAHHRVLLVRFFGSMTLQDLSTLDRTAHAFVAREGVVRVIADFTDVSKTEFATSTITNRGLRKPIMGDQPRIYVASTPELFGLARLFASYQENVAGRGPKIVATMAEAYRAFDLTDPDFQPVAIVE
jgi:hypothetical protein